jgi:hypothetical protein
MYMTERSRIFKLPNAQVSRDVLGMKEALRSMLRMKRVLRPMLRMKEVLRFLHSHVQDGTLANFQIT